MAVPCGGQIGGSIQCGSGLGTEAHGEIEKLGQQLEAVKEAGGRQRGVKIEELNGTQNGLKAEHPCRHMQRQRAFQ